MPVVGLVPAAISPSPSDGHPAPIIHLRAAPELARRRSQRSSPPCATLIDVPAGLDGHRDPVVTPERDSVLNAVADLVHEHQGPRTLVGVDGRSGAGKSTFADELADRLTSRGRSALRSTTDSFHRPRAERLQRGPTSAKGYYLDSHQVEVIVDELLTPFADGASQVRTAAFDEPSDAHVEVVSDVDPTAVLVFDGLFLQRPELSGHWDVVGLPGRGRAAGTGLARLFCLGSSPMTSPSGPSPSTLVSVRLAGRDTETAGASTSMPSGRRPPPRWWSITMTFEHRSSCKPDAAAHKCR